MKKNIKKIFGLALSLLTIGALTGCGGKGNESESISIPDNPTGMVGSLKVSAFEGGAGSTWLQAVVDAYKVYNPYAKITVNMNPLVRDEAATACQTNSTDSDIFFLDGASIPFYVENQHSIAEISEVFTSPAKVGDKEEDITIAEKIKPEIVSEMKYAGDQKQYQNKYYTAPFASGPCSLIFNVDALNNVFGEGRWTEPKTSNELIDFCNKIVEKDAKVKIAGANYTVYPFIYGGTALEYWRYLYYTWIAQYDEFENWSQFTKCKIDGEYNIEAYFTPGKQKAYKQFEQIIKRANGYCDPTSMSNKYTTSQKYFIQGRACMYLCGDWLEREMQNSTSYNSNMKMIRVPLTSDLSEKIESKFSVKLGNTADEKDKKLSAIVTAVDNGKTSLEGVSQEVFDFVKNTRGITFTLGNTSYCFVPACSKNQEMAVDFLRFLYSDEGIQIIYSDTKTLIPVKDPSKFKLIEDEITSFRKSVLEIYNDDITKLVYCSNADPIRYRAGLNEYMNNEKPEVAMGKKTGALTAEEYLEKERTLLSAKWSDLLRYA